VNPERRLADIISALESAEILCLVMGGHAVRFYGLSRSTIDFDLHSAPDSWAELSSRLARTPLFAGKPVLEGPSWRPHSFRRFLIGRLADGREEWLEFWGGNHLLAPFAELYARREQGPYGGKLMSFLGLPDLMKSKETERARDWQDIAVLEEYLDARMLAETESGARPLAEALCHIRSRAGFEMALQRGHFSDAKVVDLALGAASLAITQAFLLPFAPAVTNLQAPTPAIEPVIMSRLRTVLPASPLHLTLVEAVRRQYRLFAQAVDRADKDAVRAAPGE